MADAATPLRYLRDREDEDSARVSFVELFYDLVFVFAVTRLTGYVLDNLTPEGLVRAAVLFLAMWWLWITTSWATNRLDPDRALVRGVIFALMAAGLMFSVSIPVAFEEWGMVFAVAYVGMQVGRSLFMARVMAWHEEDGQRRTFERMTVWFALSGVLWIGGALAEGDTRILLWALALTVELTVPWLGYAFPGLGRSATKEWDIEGEHLAERCGLFIILSLGESLLVTGSRVEPPDWDAWVLAGFAVAFLSSVVMWWIYFDVGARRGTRAFERSSEPGRLARFAYTYVHLPIVAGIVVAAVGDKLLLDHPAETADLSDALVLLGGAGLFLLGNYLFKNATSRRWPLSHVLGMGLLALAPLAVGSISTLALAAWALGALLLVATAERVMVRSRVAVQSGVT